MTRRLPHTPSQQESYTVQVVPAAALDGRETAEPDDGLTPEVIARLRAKLSNP